MIGFTVSVGLDLKGPRGRVLNGRRSSTGGVVVSATAADGGNVKKADTLVVGSGVSGSSLAFALHKKGLNVLMTEARDRIGGNVITKQENGYTWEEGPNTFQPAPHIMRMAVDLGLKDDVVLADHTLPRFVFWNGKLFALPLGPSDIPKFRLLSPWGFIRAGLGAIGLVMPNTSGKEESVKEFVTRHLGKEVYERIIDPFVSGVYAGNPMSLSMSAAFKKIFALEQLGSTNGLIEGGIIRLQQRKKEAPPPDPELPTYKGGALGSFKNGLISLPKAVVEKIGSDNVKLEWKMESIETDEDGNFVTKFQTPSGTETVLSKTVALTAPAYIASGLLEPLIGPSAKRLDEINYPCVYSVNLGYRKEAFKTPLKGFGNLIPRSMGITTLGTIWSSCLFPGRAPEGMELLLSYIGGAQNDKIAGQTADEVCAQVHNDVKNILLKDDPDIEPVVLGVRKWERAIPQANLGYKSILNDVEEAKDKFPGLFLGGNYVSGVAFGDCVLWGVETAEAVEKQLKATH
uniref:Protoporphyrinogen oxidase n=1 Tax=Rhodosorus marinus TaxID=101924 RepID=A0A7S3ENC5_9RHOD|mmetsp:Transcript_4644/g.19877  ORF Transcript_4644/g.19877 Transcript_4644/m.19877 type:complete len:516 (+) Transcript_4644:71-1618(+)